MNRSCDTRCWFGLSLVLFASLAFGQKQMVVFNAPAELPARWFKPIEAGSAQQVPAIIDGQLAFLHGQGYLEARITGCTADSVDRRVECDLEVGRPYRWARLSGAGIPFEFASEARFRERLFNGRPIAPRELRKLIEDLLRRSEDNGFPFASVRLDSLRESVDGLHATIRMDLGRQVRIDSVVIRGDARTNLRYVQSHIGIREGDLYQEATVRSIERRLRELPFIAQRQRPYVQFTEERTKLFLFLDSKRASSINGILGVQPDALTGKVKITGDLDLRLRNALRRGESIDLNWRSLADATQDLKARLNLPFAFGTPFGMDGQIKLFKRDTSFLEVALRGGLDYLMLRGDRLGVFVNSKTSERLGRTIGAIPGLADVKVLSYGISLSRERFDYRFNPRRGHSARLEGSVGRKRTTTAVIGQEEPPPGIRSAQYEVEGVLVGHLAMGKRGTVRFGLQGGAMINDDLYRNELFRFGGLRTLRGTDEASIYASSFAIGTIEYRYVYEENANFFAFFDQGWWEDASRNGGASDRPIGFGAGTTFETKAGLFSLTYALGRQFENAVLLRGGKIHFGFTSLF